MYEEQEIIEINKDDLLKKVQAMHDDHYRLVQIACAQTDMLYVDYSFDKDRHFINFRVWLPEENPKLPTISKIYLAAFTYENEIHDLFGVKIADIVIDFKGKFYRKAEETPFLRKKSSEEE